MNRVLQTIGEAIWRDWLAAAIASGALPTATTAVAVATVQSTPPVGTPTPNGYGGNSAPVRALVAGVLQSERTGEHRGAK